MIFGMTPLVFVHVLISLIGIAAGFVVVAGMLGNKRYDSWTSAFLITTITTSLTGFVLPATQFLASHLFGIISLVMLVLAVVARYQKNLVGSWRWIYVASVIVALYLNVFVLVVQIFLKVPVAKALAPTQSDPPFLIAQFALLVVSVFIGIRAVSRFSPAGKLPATAAHS